jgi:hypothetical protein
MVAMKTYTAIASPDERWWFIRIPGLGNNPDEGLPTQARRLSDVEPMARDLIAVYLDVPEDSFDVEVKVELPDGVRHHLELAAKYAEDAAHAQAAAAGERRAAARELKAGGLTVRDIGAALGISHQRAQQLVSR